MKRMFFPKVVRRWKNKLMLADVLREFSDRLGRFGPVVIAGGAVRDTLLGNAPKDYDVFVLGTEFKVLSEDAAKALAGLEQIVPLEFHKSEPFLVAMVRWNGCDVQVMSTPHTTVDELLASFDWNVCLFAYDGTYVQREDTANIRQGGALRLRKVTFPLSTLRRGFRFSERFGMEFKREDIVTLCERVAKATSRDKAAF